MQELKFDQFVPRDETATEMDQKIASGLMSFANKRTRRSFLALVGRGSVALLGASFLSVWRAEKAWGACTCGGQADWSERLTCMCHEVWGNCCDFCCSGFWVTCPVDNDNPANCCYNCPDTGKKVCQRVRLYDCCDKCGDLETPNKAGCSSFGNDFCRNEGYCPFGCGTYQNGWRVRCVRKDCITGDFCYGTCPN